MTLSLAGWRPGNLSFIARLLLGCGLALAACAVALLYSILRGEIADQRATLTEHLREEMTFALPAMSGPAVVGEYSVIEQMVKARARQPVIARFAWTDNFGHAVAAQGPASCGGASGNRSASSCWGRDSRSASRWSCCAAA